MGTRRSQHNYGRKPRYKEHRRNLVEQAEPGSVFEIGRDRWPNGFLWHTRARQQNDHHGLA